MISDDWQDVLEAMAKHTSSLAPIPPPTSLLPTPTSTVSAIPTVIPHQPVFEHVQTAGSRTLWVVFALMLIASGGFTVLSWRIPVSRRVFHILTTLITIIATLSYYAMATGHGVSYRFHRVHNRHKHVPDTYDDVFRQVFWARYVDWFLTTPLLIVDLGLLSGMAGGHILLAVLADLIMITTGLFSAVGHNSSGTKWGWYTVACVSYLVVVWHLVLNGRVAARARSPKVGNFFNSIALFTIVVWTAYPIIWALGDGTHRLSVDSEIIAYAVLDVLAKGVFGSWLLFTHANIPESNVEITGFWSHGIEEEGSLRLREDGA